MEQLKKQISMVGCAARRGLGLLLALSRVGLGPCMVSVWPRVGLAGARCQLTGGWA